MLRRGVGGTASGVTRRRLVGISRNHLRVIDADGQVIGRDRELLKDLPPPYQGHTCLFSFPFSLALGRTRRASRKAANGSPKTSLEIPTGQDWLGYLDEAELKMATSKTASTA